MSYTPQAIADHFKIALGDQPCNFNIAPGRTITAVRLNPQTHQREWASLHWGLVPHGAAKSTEDDHLIFARVETVLHKPAFRQVFRLRRCLIPADGFYECKREAHQKVPYFVRLRTGHLLALGGVWDQREDANGGMMESCALLTTEANDLVRPMHHRMPLIIRPEQYDLWLNPDTPVEQAEALLHPYPAREMTAYPVANRIHAATAEEPAMIEPARTQPGEEAAIFRPLVEEPHRPRAERSPRDERTP